MEVGSATAPAKCRDCGGTGSPGGFAGGRIICTTCGGTGVIMAVFGAILPLPEKPD